MSERFSTRERPELLGSTPAKNVVFRVYHPPLPLEATDSDGGRPAIEWRGEKFFYRDFVVQRVEFTQEGSMMLHSQHLVERKPDLERGGLVEAWMAIIAAVIDHEGHLRAESVVLPDQASEAGDGGVN